MTRIDHYPALRAADALNLPLGAVLELRDAVLARSSFVRLEGIMNI